MCYYEGRFCTARDDQVSEVSVVRLHIALAGPERETLFEKLAK